MAQGPSDTILVAIRITLRIRESKVRNPDPPDRRRFVLSECILDVCVSVGALKRKWLELSTSKSIESTAGLRHEVALGSNSQITYCLF